MLGNGAGPSKLPRTYKRRTRTKVCSNCRRKKIKCNRQKPCENCVNSHLEDSCEYKDNVYSGNSINQKKETVREAGFILNQDKDIELQYSKKQIADSKKHINSARKDKSFNLSSNTGEADVVFNLFKMPSVNLLGYQSIVSNRPLSWSSSSKNDIALSLMWLYIKKRKSSEYLKSTSTNNPLSNIVSESEVQTIVNTINEKRHSPDILFRKMTLLQSEFKDLVPVSVSRSILTDEIVTRETKNPSFIGMRLLDTTNYDKLSKKICEHLPQQNITWDLIEFFFEYLYPSMPFLDECEFIKEIRRITDSESENAARNEFFKSLNVEKRLDFAYLGILLSLIQLSHLCLRRDEDHKKKNVRPDKLSWTETHKWAKETSPNPETLSLAVRCLSMFDFYSKTHFPVLQCAMFIRMFELYTPELGDTVLAGDSQVHDSILIQIAYSLDLNREPELFESSSLNEKRNSLIRKIWWYLVVTDTVSSSEYGNSLLISEKTYDTKCPFSKLGNATISNYTLENKIFDNYQLLAVLTDKQRKILEGILDLKSCVKMKLLEAQLEDFENLVCDRLGGLLSYNCQDSRLASSAIPRLSYLISCKCFVMSVYFNMAIICERHKSNGLSFTYLKKALAIIMIDLLPNARSILNTLNGACGLIVTPKIELWLHKASQVLVCVIIHLNILGRRLQSDSYHEQLMNSDSSYRENNERITIAIEYYKACGQFCLKSLNPITDIYYYGWVINSAHSFLYQNSCGEDLFNTIKNNPLISSLHSYNNKEVSELIAISKGFLETADNVESTPTFTDSMFSSIGDDRAANQGWPEINDVPPIFDASYNNTSEPFPTIFSIFDIMEKEYPTIMTDELVGPAIR
ncbi:Piso0_003678 [Millerozyma farinosa CBS 7064]|uniref:Piso0_003678 protein n=1 Tax=Pichia sorbitophila (strain ATCC MYA-4447 / BCRC 22081 / CBS 7064 / NBRC 10061 / NRRL Y-12695) TaxID=559304 RepID=G8Y6A7_PICSO|nr:Piso0_003678 [Millerozyma farinosa CBS 7064]CCE84137.1 Piso0_003678 [Millerozyma farinosa CBS 7064]